MPQFTEEAIDQKRELLTLLYRMAQEKTPVRRRSRWPGCCVKILGLFPFPEPVKGNECGKMQALPMCRSLRRRLKLWMTHRTAWRCPPYSADMYSNMNKRTEKNRRSYCGVWQQENLCVFPAGVGIPHQLHLPGDHRHAFGFGRVQWSSWGIL